MTRTILTAAILAALASPALAHHRTDTEKTVDEVGGLMGPSTGFGTDDFTASAEQLERLARPAACVAATKDLADDAHVYTAAAYLFDDKAQDAEGWYITGADAKSLCARYAKAYVHETVESAITFALLANDTMKRPVEGMYEAEAGAVGDRGKACDAAVDAALAAGLPATEVIVSKKYGLPAIALGDAKAKYCQPAIDWAQKRLGEIKGAGKAKQDAIVAVYKNAGIKGKRLELYVSYGLPDNTGFFAAGCESYVTSLPALKTAKKLFVWLEGNDGYTIRTFTFHGDDYTISEHSYDTQAQAYRGCH